MRMGFKALNLCGLHVCFEQTVTHAALWLSTAYNVAATLASVPAGRASDKRGAIGVLAVGIALLLVAYVGFAVPSPNLFVLAFGFVAAGVGKLSPAGRTYNRDSSQPDP